MEQEIQSSRDNYSSQQNELSSPLAQFETEKKELFTTIVETVPNFIGIIQDEKFVFVNSTGLRLLQYEISDDIIGKNIFDILHPNLHTTIKNRLNSLTENKTNAPIHIQFLKTDGDYIDLEANSTPFVYNNKPAGLIAGRDITNELLQKRKLQEENDRHEAVLNSFPELIAFYELDHTIRWMNNAAKKQYDITNDLYIGQHCYRIKYNSDKPCADCPMFLNKKEVHERIVHDRNRIWNVRHTPIFDIQGEITGYSELSVDITKKEKRKAEFKKAEIELKESEQRFREIFENSSDYIFVNEVTDDMRYRYLDFNPAFEKFSGFNRTDLIGKYPEQVFPPGVAEKRNQLYRQCLDTKESILNTEVRQEHAKGARSFLLNLIPIPDHNGKIYRILGMIRDITERKQMEELLKQKQTSLEEAQRIGKIGSWEIDLTTNHIERSDEILRIYEMEPQSDVSSDVILSLIHPEDREKVKNAHAESVETKQPYTIEYRLLFTNGSVKYLSESCETTFNTHGNPTRRVGIVQDITERKQYEQRLSDSLNFIEKVINSIPEPIFIKDKQHRFILSNDAHCKFRGLSRKEIVGKTDFDLFSKTEAQSFWDDEEEILSLGKETKYDHYIDDAKGNRTFIVLRKVCFTGSDGEKYIAGNIHDITERKVAEEQLRMSEMKFRTLAENSPDIIVRYDKECNRSYFNPEFKKLASFAESDLMGTTPEHITPLPSDSLSGYLNTIKKVIDTAQPQSMELCVSKPENTFWYSMMAVPEFDTDGNFTGVLAIARDITEQKTNVQKIEMLSFAINNASDAVFISEEKKPNFSYVNDQACRSLGYSREELLGLTVFDFNPDATLEVLREIEANFASGKLSVFETLHKTKDGRIFPVEITNTRYWHNNTTYVMNVVHDISERKRAEQVLHEERKLFIGGPNVAFKWKAVDGWPVEYVSPNIFEQFGYTPEELISGKVPFAHIVHPDDLPLIAQEVVHYGETKVPYFEQEYRIICANGEYRWVYDFTIVGRDVDGEITHYKGYLTNITERKLAEEKLHLREQEFRTLVENSPDIIVRYDKNCNRIYFNPAFQKLAGFQEQELAGTSPTQLSPLSADQAAVYMNTVRRVFETSRSQSLEIHQPFAGNELWFNMRAVPEFDKDGNVSSVLAVARDVTEIKKTKEMSEMLSIAVDNSSDAIFIKEIKEEHFSYVNQQACKSLGYTREEFSHLTIFDFVPDITKETVIKMQSEAHQNNLLLFESRHKRKDGSVFPVEATVIFFDYAGKSYAMNHVRDITERKLAEQALRESEEKFSTVFKLSPAGLAITRLSDNVMLDVNNVFLQSTGRNYSEVVGHNQYELDLGLDLSVFEPLRSLGNVQNYEYNYKNREGKIEYGLLSLAIITIGGEHCVLSQSVMITEIKNKQKELEEAYRRLEENEQRYREMFDNSHDSIYLLEVLDGPHFRLLDANPKYEKEVGIDREKNIGHTIEENTTPEVAAIVNAKYKRCLEAGTILQGTVELAMPQGKRTYHSSLIPIRNQSGEIYRIMGITRDITEEIKAKRALEDSQKRLAKAELVAMLGHTEYDFGKGIYHWSDGAYEILNVPAILRRPGHEGFRDLIHPDDFERVNQALNKAVQEHTKYDEVYRVIDFNGKEKVIHGFGEVATTGNGKEVSFFGIIQDITLTHNLNAQLIAEEKKFRILAECAPVGIYLTIGETPVYANKTMLDMVGASSMETLSLINLTDIVIPEDRPKIGLLAEKLRIEGEDSKPFKLTLRKFAENSTIRLYDVHVTIFTINTTRYLQFIISDITEDYENEQIRQQLAASSLYIGQKNQFATEIETSLKDILAENVKYNQSDFKPVMDVLKSFSYSDKDWELLNAHLTNIHPEFVVNLKKQCPTLSVNDIKHCACMRLNLNTKEIARIFNVKPESIQTSRSRLKKKLGLPESTDLRAFILNL